MKKIFVKTILISIAIFSAGFLFVLPTNATPVAPLIVEYSTDGGITWLPLSGPIFSEKNFIPGDGVSRLIRVTNNSGQTQRIATEAINENDPDNLASQLNLTIKEGATVIFNNTLAQFFSQGETYLSSLATGAQTQYDFKIVFKLGAEDIYQEKGLGFDILVGFEGQEGGLPLPPPGGGTGVLPSGLTIFNEVSSNVAQESVTIAWTTTYESTSWVIYAKDGEPYTFDLSQPNYGYPHASIEDTTKVVDHSVTIFGLIPGTTYHYRCVSHASLAVSTEHNFTTLMEARGETGDSDSEGTNNQVAGVSAENEGAIGLAKNGTEKEIRGAGNLLAGIGGSSGIGNFWWLILIIFMLIVAFWYIALRKKRD